MQNRGQILVSSKEVLINSFIVIPAHAGIQGFQ